MTNTTDPTDTMSDAERQREERQQRIAVFPRMPAKQFAPGKCVPCGLNGDTPVTPVRFGDFGTGVVVPMCDRCLAHAADMLAVALDKVPAPDERRSLEIFDAGFGKK